MGSVVAVGGLPDIPVGLLYIGCPDLWQVVAEVHLAAALFLFCVVNTVLKIAVQPNG